MPQREMRRSERSPPAAPAARPRRIKAVDVEAGLLALRVVEAAQLSSRLGRRVTLDEIS